MTTPLHPAPPNAPAGTNGGLASGASQRPLPTAPRLAVSARRRRPALWLLGTALVATGGALAAAAALSAGHRVEVLAVARPVPAGQVIAAADLRPARVAADPALTPIPAAQLGTVVGRHAAVDLRPGTLLVRAALTSDSIPGVGQALVGVAVKPGQLPARPLQRGDRVLAVTVPDPGAATDAADSEKAPVPATVAGVGRTDPNGSVVVDLTVAQAPAARLATDAAGGRVA